MQIINNPDLKTRRHYSKAQLLHEEIMGLKRQAVAACCEIICHKAKLSGINNEQAEAHVAAIDELKSISDSAWRAARQVEYRYHAILNWFPDWFLKKCRKFHESKRVCTYRIEVYVARLDRYDPKYGDILDQGFPTLSGDWEGDRIGDDGWRIITEGFVGTQAEADLFGQRLKDEWPMQPENEVALEYAVFKIKNPHQHKPAE